MAGGHAWKERWPLNCTHPTGMHSCLLVLFDLWRSISLSYGVKAEAKAKKDKRKRNFITFAFVLCE